MRRGNFAAAWKVSDRVLRRHLRMREAHAPAPRHAGASGSVPRSGPRQRALLPQLCRLARDTVSRLQPRLFDLLPRAGSGRLGAHR